MKKILALLIAGLLLVSLVACGDEEEQEETKKENVVQDEYVEDEEKTGKFEYAENEKGEFEITGYEPNTIKPVDLVLPSKAEGRNITGIAKNAFDGLDTLVSVTIPESYEYIGDYAFAGCENLKSITMTDNVESIGMGAFMNCGVLNKVKLSSKITKIAEHTFSGCTSLDGIDLSNIITIQNGAFTNCKALKTATVSDKLEYATKKAFMGCDKLNYTEKDGLCYLGNDKNGTILLVTPKTTNIEECAISDTTKVIADHAFINCKDLTSIKLSAAVKVINGTSFEDCPDDIYTVSENGKYLGTEANPYMVLIKLEMPNVEDFKINKDVKIITATAFAESSTARDIDFDGTEAEWDANIAKAEGWNNRLALNIFCSDSDNKPIEIGKDGKVIPKETNK